MVSSDRIAQFKRPIRLVASLTNQTLHKAKKEKKKKERKKDREKRKKEREREGCVS
jgi:hypothetical protein